VFTNFWVRNFGRVHKSAPGAFSPFSFSKIQPLSTNKDKDRSLLLDIYSGQKGGLLRNLEDIKASTKTTDSVPQDYHLFVFQVEAYSLSKKYIVRVNSLLTRQLCLFVEKIKHHSIAYKNQFTLEK
jgi:hypothetical protein